MNNSKYKEVVKNLVYECNFDVSNNCGAIYTTQVGSDNNYDFRLKATETLMLSGLPSITITDYSSICKFNHQRFFLKY